MVFIVRKRTMASKRSAAMRSAADRFSRLSRFAVNDNYDDDDDDSSSDYGLVRGGAIIMKRGFRSTKQGRSRSGVGRGQHFSGDSGEDRGYEEESDSDDDTSDISSSSDGGSSRGYGTRKRRRTIRGYAKRRRMGRRSCCIFGGKITDDLAAGDR
uniref:Uncharacterized protein n=1 Tax=Schizaphis graminum TaxID=13262 RepID=A0A2S2PEF2_SCHGA